MHPKLNKIIPALLLFLCLGISFAWSQFALTSGDHSLELSGTVSTFYNFRFMKPAELSKDKNRFDLRDAQLQFEGRYARLFEYKVQVDIADLASSFAGAPDPENPGLMDAWLQYKGLKFVNITAGYGKVNYSRASLTALKNTAWWQRAEISRGEIFSRRDVGVTLDQSLWNQRINLYAGVYTGLGEISLRGENDASGNPEYVGRVEFAWPSRYRMMEIDFRRSPLPMFSLGLNGRYLNKTLPAGEAFPAFANSGYGIKLIDGARKMWSFDFAAQYKGFSLQGEFHYARYSPDKSGNLYLMGLPDSLTGKYFNLGGMYLQAHYYFKPLASVLSFRFEDLNLNDLNPGRFRKINVGYNFLPMGQRLILRVQYFHVLEEDPADPLKWTDQVRAGVIFNF